MKRTEPSADRDGSVDLPLCSGASQTACRAGSRELLRLPCTAACSTRDRATSTVRLAAPAPCTSIHRLPPSSFPDLPASIVATVSISAAVSSPRPTKPTIRKTSSTPVSSTPALRLGRPLLRKRHRLAAGLLRERARSPHHPRHRSRNRAACNPTIPAASSASTGASTPHRRSACMRRKRDCPTGPRLPTTMPSPTPSSTTVPSFTSMPRASGRWSTCRNNLVLGF